MASVAGQHVVPDISDEFPEYRRGVLLGALAYGLWGLFPLFWTLLDRAGALETLAQRMVWSMISMAGVLWWIGRRRGTGYASVRAVLRDRRKLGLLSIAAVLIATNWGVYIWGVNNGHVVETALGYFTGPLVSVLIGVLLLGERLRVLQWVAVGLGAIAVVVLAVGYGEVPWIALVLACSFSTYGLVKKLANVGAVDSVAIETGVTLLPALVYLVILESAGNGTFFSIGIDHTLLFVAGGVITTLPLLAFAGAATRIPLSMIGLLQYLAPVLQFAFGVLVFHEAMPPERWLGFAIVWAGLLVLTVDSARRRTPKAVLMHRKRRSMR